MLQTICNYIVLASAVLLALTNIVKFFKKPVDAAQHHQQEEFEKKFDERFYEKLPEFLDKRAVAVKAEREEEYRVLLEKINQIVSAQTLSYFEEIEKINLEQNAKIELLMNSSKDLLRQYIIDVYNHNKELKTLTETEREFLDECFNDYEKEHGNGYIAKLYHKMDKWEIIDD